MPNMPAKIGKGMSCLCKGRFASEEDLSFSKGLFDKLGKTLFIKEDMMDAATAISGSGPGYYFDLIASEQENYHADKARLLGDFIDSLARAAEAVGFSPDQARLLADATGVGSQALIEATNLSPAELRAQITSKGGTTEAALRVLHQGGTLEEAVKAALNRARELARS
jgi:pyrroline-5-carboxylate reductase